jgi:hypothetical protein
VAGSWVGGCWSRLWCGRWSLKVANVAVEDAAGHCCFVHGGKSLDSFGGLFDQMARVSSVKAAITRRVVGSSMPSS